MRFARPNWIDSLSFRVVLAYFAGTLLSTGLTAVFVMSVLGQPLMSGGNVAMGDLLKSLHFDAKGQPVAPAHSEDFSWVYKTMGTEVTYRVLDAEGRVVLAPGADLRPLNTSLKSGTFVTELDGISMRGRTVLVENSGRQWVVQFAASVRLNDRLHNDLWLPLVGSGALIAGCVLLVVLSALTGFTLARVLRPLRDVSAAVTRITPQALDSRLNEGRVPLEIRPLVQSFNGALERLERAFQVQQEFLAAAAHELKTPLSLIRAQLDAEPNLVKRGPLLKDLERMTRQVQQLLHLAEASEPQNYRFGSVHPQELLAEVCAYLQRLANAAGVHLRLQVATNLPPWNGDLGALFTLLKNLVENAIQHSPRGKTVLIQAGPQGLCVIDEGTGVAAEELPKLFARFWRGMSRRDEGAGLGLSICQRIAQAHGGSLTAELREPGLCMRLEFKKRPN
jgi:two-component system sensor histidine kinase QseC